MLYLSFSLLGLCYYLSWKNLWLQLSLDISKKKSECDIWENAHIYSSPEVKFFMIIFFSKNCNLEWGSMSMNICVHIIWNCYELKLKSQYILAFRQTHL